MTTTAAIQPSIKATAQAPSAPTALEREILRLQADNLRLADELAKSKASDYRAMMSLTVGGGKVVYGHPDDISVAQTVVLNAGRLRYAIMRAVEKMEGMENENPTLQTLIANLSKIAEMREIPAQVPV